MRRKTRQRMRLVELYGNTAFITGAGSGIGRAVAFALAKKGMRLGLTYHKNKQGILRVARQCLKFGAPEAYAVRLDVKSSESIRKAAKLIRAGFKTVSVLINNAGVNVEKPFQKQTPKDIEEQLETNLGGVIRVTKAFLPMVEDTIINVASRAGKIAIPNMAVYSATKFGVRGFTQALAKEYPRLRIYSVNPDRVATRMVNYKGRPPEEVAEVILRLLLGRYKIPSGGDVDVWKILAK